MNPTYSFSKLEMFEKCPWAFKQVYREKIPRAESEPLTIGKDTHKLVGDYISRLVNTEQVTDWEWAQGLLTPSTHPDVAEIFQRFCSNFILPPIENSGIEKKLAFARTWEPCEYHAPEVFFRMVLDFSFLQGGIAVVKDWKTNYQVINIDPDNIPLQLRIYAWGAWKTIFPDAQEILLQYHFLRYGAEREILLTPESLSTVPQELEAKIAVIEAERYFAPQPGSFCSWCGVTAHCPVMSQALIPVEIMAPATREQAEKAATLLLTLEAMEKALKERLKEWVKEYGPVVVGDMSYGENPTQTYNLDAQVVAGYLLEAGIEKDAVWSFLGITKTGLERGLSKMRRKDLLPPILALSECKEGSRIEFRKIK